MGDVLTREGSDARLILFLEGGSLSGVRLRKRPLPTPVQSEVEGGEGLDVVVEGNRTRGVVLGLAEAMEGSERYVRQRSNCFVLYLGSGAYLAGSTRRAILPCR